MTQIRLIHKGKLLGTLTTVSKTNIKSKFHGFISIHNL